MKLVHLKENEIADLVTIDVSFISVTKILPVVPAILAPDGDLIANTETIIRDDGAVSDLGYPKTCCLIDGRIFVVYYINRKTDATNVVFSSGLLITLKVNRPKNGLRRESHTRSNKDS